MREFLHSDNLADACIFLMNNTEFRDLAELTRVQGEGQDEIRNTHINIGTDTDLTLKDLAHLIKEIVGFKGSIRWDDTKPDGTPRKLMDVSKIEKLGWKATITLEQGMRKVYNHYKEIQ